MLAVLHELSAAGGPVHGWRLAELANQSGPNVYRALRRLQDAAWVDCEWAESSEPGRPRRRLYWLTAVGRHDAARLLAEQDVTVPAARMRGGHEG